MAIISNGTTIASGGSLSVSATPPTSVNAVGTYGFIIFDNGGTSGALGIGGTLSHSSMKFTNLNTDNPTNIKPSGTWRVMGAHDYGNVNRQTTVGVRIA